jgi:hypothetical protein
MATTYSPVTITAEEGPAFLFETECVAQVEYEIEDNVVTQWTITDFRFDAETNVWDDTAGKWLRRAVASVWCPEELRPVLIKYIDRKRLDEDLHEKLFADGEIGLSNYAEEISDYHASVL